MPSEEIASIILAAGYSSRMKAFKPLLRLGDASVVERIVGAYKDAGVHNIYVVVGHQAHQLEQ